MPLPDWIKPVEGFKHRYVIDPDQFYPQLLSELAALYHSAGSRPGDYAHVGRFWPEDFSGLNSEEPDQYWLEVCHQLIKLDAQVALAAAGKTRRDVSLVLIIRGSEPGYKDRWAMAQYKPGDRMAAIREKLKQTPKLVDRFIAGEARQHYKALRGFLPA